MTKAVRIENADNSKYKLIVEIWDKGQNGAPDVLSSTKELPYPTALAEVYIHSGRYLVIKENGENL
jgi:hypothetical protein